MIDRFVRESHMLGPLISYLEKTRRVNQSSILIEEFPWFGRRVDLAVLTKSKRTAAYELKISNSFKVIEQASKNALAFDRSYAVISSDPSDEALEFANESGVGVIVLAPARGKCILAPREPGPDAKFLRRRLIDAMLVKANREKASAYV